MHDQETRFSTMNIYQNNIDCVKISFKTYMYFCYFSWQGLSIKLQTQKNQSSFGMLNHNRKNIIFSTVFEQIKAEMQAFRFLYVSKIHATCVIQNAK